MENESSAAEILSNRRKRLVILFVITVAIFGCAFHFFPEIVLQSRRSGTGFFAAFLIVLAIISDSYRCPQCKRDLLRLFRIQNFGDLCWAPCFCPYCQTKLTSKDVRTPPYYPRERIPLEKNKPVLRNNLRSVVMWLFYVVAPLGVGALCATLFPNVLVGRATGSLIAAATIIWMAVGVWIVIRDPGAPRCRACRNACRSARWRYCPRCGEALVHLDGVG